MGGVIATNCYRRELGEVFVCSFQKDYIPSQLNFDELLDCAIMIKGTILLEKLP